MKRAKIIFLTLAILVAAVVLVAFATRKKTEEVSLNSPPLKYHAEFKTEPATIKANESVDLQFTVRNEAGKSVRFLERVHEQLLHLLIVSDDLQEFYHIHPELITDYFSIGQAFPNGGKYHLFADYTPPGGKNTVEHFTIEVKGKSRPKVALTPDKNWAKTLDGLKVEMSAEKEIRAREDFLMTFKLADEKTNQPATDMQLYLGALSHIAVFSQDLSEFIHAHPLEEGEFYDPLQGLAFHSHNPEDAAKKMIGPSPSEVKVPMIFPKAGIYKIYAQFKRNEEVIAVPFVVSVAENNAVQNMEEIPADAIVVSGSKTGYEPSRIELQTGKPVKLAFQRIDAENCGSKVVFKSLNITRDLPVGKTVIVEFTPTESGDIGFACEMGMYKGILVIN
jgi:Cupredoxin-like domain